MAVLSLPGRRSNAAQATPPRPVVTVRPRWRRRLVQLMTTLFVYSLPLLVVITRSSPGTGIWLLTGLSHLSAEQVVIEAGTPPTAYALLTQGGVWYSSDEGVSWLAADRDLPNESWGQIRVHTLALDSLEPGLLLAGIAGSGARDPLRSAGLYVSTDKGQSWQAPGRVFAGQEIQAIVIQALDLDHRACVASDIGIYCANLAADQLRSPEVIGWRRLDWLGSEARVTTMAIPRGDEDLLFVGTDSLGLYVTRDAGKTWSAVSLGTTGLRINDLLISTVDGGWVYAATDQGIYRSTNRGTDWAALPDPPGGNAVLSAAGDPRSARILYVGLDRGGVCFTTDGGNTWSEMNRGLGNAQVRSLAVDPTDPAILWAATTDGIWRYAHARAPEETLARGPTDTPEPTLTSTTTPVPSPTLQPALAMTLTPEPTATSPSATMTPQPSQTPTPSPTVATATPTATLTATARTTAEPSPTYSPTPVPTETNTPRPPEPTLTLVVR